MGNLSLQPLVSVIITTYQAQKTVSTCLDSLSRQVSDIPFEIIVVDSSTDNTSEIVKQYPQVLLLHFDTRKYCGDARNIGFKKAKADILACIDADCMADPDWIARIYQAHQSSMMVIGGSIANALPANLVSWAAYFNEFTQWLPGTAQGTTTDVAGANVSYKKKIFDLMGSFIEGTYCSDTEFHWRLTKAGYPIYFDPIVRIQHQSIQNIAQFIRHEYHHGFSFARMRVRAQSFSSWRRFLYSFFWFLIPLKLLIDIFHRIMKTRYHLSTLFFCLLFLMVGLTAWSMGEGIGYLRTKNSPTSTGGINS